MTNEVNAKNYDMMPTLPVQVIYIMQVNWHIC